MLDEINKLKGMKRKIEVMSDNYERNLLIMNYLHLLYYLIDAGKLSKKEIAELTLQDDIKSFMKVLNKNNINYMHELEINNPKLLTIDYDLYNIYSEGNWNKKDQKNFISNEEGYHILESFLKTLGSHIFDLWQEVKKSHISYLDNDIKDTDGTCYAINGNNLRYSYINIREPMNDMSSFVALAHEVGHAYQFHLLRNHSEICYYNAIDEVTSLLFEKLFIEYIKNAHKYSYMVSGLYHTYHKNHFWLLMDLLLTSTLLQEKMISKIEFDLTCQTYFAKEDVINLASEMGYIIDKMPHLNLYDYVYVIGDLISDYYLKIIQKDFQKGFREFIDFLQEAKYYSLTEIIEKYMSDLSYTKERIQGAKYCSKGYQKKKAR